MENSKTNVNGSRAGVNHPSLPARLFELPVLSRIESLSQLEEATRTESLEVRKGGSPPLAFRLPQPVTLKL